MTHEDSLIRRDPKLSGGTSGWALIGSSPNAAVSRGATVTFGGRIWGLDGDRGRTVVSSADGINWEANSSLPYRLGAAACAHNGALWVTGGASDDVTSDVFSSADGLTWTHSVAPWPARSGHCMISDGDHLLVAGGRNMEGEFFRDCWVSQNGVDWSSGGAAPNCVDGALAVVGASLCLIDSANRTVSWNDGTRWLKPEQAPWSNRLFPGVAVLDGALYLVGGYWGFTHCRDMWSATGPGTWKAQPSAPWSGARDGAGCGALDGKVIVFGGDTGGAASPEIYGYAPD